MNTLHQVLGAIEGIIIRPVHDGGGFRDGDEALEVEAMGNTWSRAVRRRKMTTGQPPPLLSTQSAVISCKISWHNRRSSSRSTEDWELEFVWVEGKERAIYESFVGHVSRKVDAALNDKA